MARYIDSVEAEFRKFPLTSKENHQLMRCITFKLGHQVFPDVGVPATQPARQGFDDLLKLLVKYRLLDTYMFSTGKLQPRARPYKREDSWALNVNQDLKRDFVDTLEDWPKVVVNASALLEASPDDKDVSLGMDFHQRKATVENLLITKSVHAHKLLTHCNLYALIASIMELFSDIAQDTQTTAHGQVIQVNADTLDLHRKLTKKDGGVHGNYRGLLSMATLITPLVTLVNKPLYSRKGMSSEKYITVRLRLHFSSLFEAHISDRHL